MPTGTVAFYHDKKGYGFIELEEEDEDDDVFFHISDVAGFTPEEGEEVEFQIEEAEKGPRAVDVEKI